MIIAKLILKEDTSIATLEQRMEYIITIISSRFCGALKITIYNTTRCTEILLVN